MGDLGKGKNKVDDIGDAKHAVTHQKTLDVVRLSSESTREHPRLLGGTPEQAKAYLNKLLEVDRPAYQAYKDYKACLRRLHYENDLHPTKTAKEAYPYGYEIYREYERIHRQNPKNSTNQPGESSTQETPKEQDPPKKEEPYDKWFYRMGYPR